MKNIFSTILTILAIVLVIKKGSEYAAKNNLDLNFFETIKRGFQLTLQSFSGSKDEIEPVKNDTDISSFSQIATQARGIHLMRRKAEQNTARFNSYEEQERYNKALDELSLRGFN